VKGSGREEVLGVGTVAGRVPQAACLGTAVAVAICMKAVAKRSTSLTKAKEIILKIIQGLMKLFATEISWIWWTPSLFNLTSCGERKIWGKATTAFYTY
jgi:hypothetical protein